MSSESASVMCEENDEKSALVPRRRFPEFRESGEWERKELSEFLFEYQQRNRDLKFGPEDVLSVSGEFGCVNQIEHLGRSYAGVSVKDYRVVETGDIVYTKSPLKRNPFGIIKENKGKVGIVSTLYAVYRAKVGAHPAYFDHYFSRDYFLNGYLQPLVKKGAKNDMKVNNSVVLSGDVIAPKKEEQQKIADCLSSLDELITAETQKLDALKTHKKGLMQQLFPREGETVPRLRFPEFREAGEWATKTLAELAENLDNRRVPVTEKDRTKGNIPYYGASGIVDYIRDFIFDEDLLCISEDGANLRARTAPIAFSISGKTWVNNHAHVLRFDSKCVQKIVEDYLNSISLEDYLTGMAQPKLNRAMLDTIPVPVPQDDDEQQAVSDCLSSLDDLITAQSQKIDAIKIHKKGLIQQLFPVLDEVPA